MTSMSVVMPWSSDLVFVMQCCHIELNSRLCETLISAVNPADLFIHVLHSKNIISFYIYITVGSVCWFLIHLHNTPCALWQAG